MSDIAVYVDDAWKFPCRPERKDLKPGGRTALDLWIQYSQQLEGVWAGCLQQYWTAAPRAQAPEQEARRQGLGADEAPQVSSTTLVWSALLALELKVVKTSVTTLELTQEDEQARQQVIEDATGLLTEVEAALPATVRNACLCGKPAPIVFNTAESPFLQGRAMIAASRAVSHHMLIEAQPAPAGSSIREDLLHRAKFLGVLVWTQLTLFEGLCIHVKCRQIPPADRRIPQYFSNEVERLKGHLNVMRLRCSVVHRLIQSTEPSIITSIAQDIKGELQELVDMLRDSTPRVAGMLQWTVANNMLRGVPTAVSDVLGPAA